MKQLKIFVLLLAVFCLVPQSIAQTFHVYFTGTATNAVTPCKPLTGYWTYRLSYHLDKDGFVTRVHWNVVSSKLTDAEGNKYRLMDTGNDNLGAFWDFFNNLNAYNKDFGITYDIEDGFLPLPPNMPDQGILVNTLKFKSKKDVIVWRTFWRVKLDRNGELQREIYKEELICD